MTHLAAIEGQGLGRRRSRALHRVLGDLRRGTPVRLVGPEGAALMLPAETADAQGLAELEALSSGPRSLVIAGGLAATLSGRPVSTDVEEIWVSDLPPQLAEPAMLHALADPSRDATRLMLDEGRDGPAAETGLARAALMACKLARLSPAAVLGRALESDGLPDDLLELSVHDLLSRRPGGRLASEGRAAEGLVLAAEATIPLALLGKVRVVAFRPEDGGMEHLAILFGAPETATSPLVRLHSECFTGDLLGSLRCDCGPQLRRALTRIAEEGVGAVLYLAQEGRGIGLVNKLRAYRLQDRGLDTLDANRALGWGADERDFGLAASILRAVGIRSVRLLTNNPAKVAGLEAHGVAVAERVPHGVPANGVDDDYLRVKRERFGHTL